MKLSEKLKNNTVSYHKSVEQALILQPIFTKELTLNQYKEILVRWHHIHHQFETQLEQHIETLNFIPNIKERLKLKLIDKDVNHLNIMLHENFIHFENKTLEHIEEIIGYLYVFEGSTLGGNMLQKHFKHVLKIEDDAINFYQSYKHEIGVYWKDFIDAIDKWGDENLDVHEQVVTAAKDCFMKIKAVFS